MPKQLNVNIGFTADTSKAKAAIQDLSNDLSKIATGLNNTPVNLNLDKAKQAAVELRNILNSSMNVNTGKLDVSKFALQLKSTGRTLESFRHDLFLAGETGEQAFFNLSRSIALAEAPVLSLGKRFSQLGVVLKNTIRWQLSSSLIHGFVRGISQAYNFSKDLNESLNNIRIVTGKTTSQMREFAQEANNAAKNLSTTTTAYTDASLIYYQQGLGDKEVKARTDTTVKMANVTGQSATEVSNQMTAIWNNFAKGADNLEHFADVVTILGANTASSSSEIAQGLEKFAAVADTVGLSYEKAAAAVATVVAETRQSADTVGTSFKTIFARLESVSLGETLEDGVGLSKYSEALAKVGVNILDQQGHLKQMDNILDELGAKWNTLNQEQQVALANTVGGVRQYAQFMALMNNYDKVLSNQGLAENSNGTLEAQAQIYAESWEAASKRVKASAESIYQELLNDNFFIKMLNGIDKALGGVKGLIEGFGGLSGTLHFIGALFMTYYAKEMPTALQNLSASFSIFTGKARAEVLELQAANNKVLEDSKRAEEGPLSSYNLQIEALKQLGTMKSQYLAVEQQLSKAEQEAYKNKIADTEAAWNNVIALGKELDAIKKLNQERQQKSVDQHEILQRKDTVFTDAGNIRSLTQRAKNFSSIQGQIQEKQGQEFSTEREREFQALGRSIDQINEKIVNLRGNIVETGNEIAVNISGNKDLTERILRQFNPTQLDEYKNKLKETAMAVEEIKNIENQLAQTPGEGGLTQQLTAAHAKFNELKQELQTLAPENILNNTIGQLFSEMAEGSKEAEQQIMNLTITLEKEFQTLGKSAASFKAVSTTIKDFGNKYTSSIKNVQSGTKQFEKAKQEAKDFGEELINMADSAGVSKEKLNGFKDKLKEALAQTDPKEAANKLQEFFNLLSEEANGNLPILTAKLRDVGDSLQLLGTKTPQEITQFLSGLDEEQQKALRAALGLNGLGNATDSLTQKTIPLSQALMQLSSGLMSLNTIMNSMQRIGDVFNNEDATAVEKISAVIAVLTGVMMGYNMLTKGMIAITQTSIGLKKKDAAATAVQTAATKGATTATGVNSVAAEINASIWRSHPIVAILSVVFMVAAAAIGYFTAQTKANSEAAKKNAEAHRDSADAINEEVEANKQLVNDYNKALKTYKETNEGRKELQQRALDVANAYGIEDAAIKLLRDDYQGLTKDINEARQAELEKSVAANYNAAAANKDVFVNAINGESHFLGIGDHTYGENGYAKGYGEVGGTLSHWIQDQDFSYFSTDAYGEIFSDIKDVNSESIVGFMEEMNLILQKARELGADNTIGAKELLKEYSKGKDIYEQINENLNMAYKDQVEQTGLKLQNEKYSDINSLEDFKNFRKDYFNNLENLAEELNVDSEKLKKVGEEYLKGLEEYADFNLQALADEVAEENLNELDTKPFYDRAIEDYIANIEILNGKFSEADWSNVINQFDSIEEAIENFKYGDEFKSKEELAKKLGIPTEEIDAWLEKYSDYFIQRGDKIIFNGDKQKLQQEIENERKDTNQTGLDNAIKTDEEALNTTNEEIKKTTSALIEVADILGGKGYTQERNELLKAIKEQDTETIGKILNAVSSGGDIDLLRQIYNILGNPEKKYTSEDLTRSLSGTELDQAFKAFVEGEGGYKKVQDYGAEGGYDTSTIEGAQNFILSQLIDWIESSGQPIEAALADFVQNKMTEQGYKELFESAGYGDLESLTPDKFIEIMGAYWPDVMNYVSNAEQEIKEGADHIAETAISLEGYYDEKSRLESKDYHDEQLNIGANSQNIKDFKDKESRGELNLLTKEERANIAEGLYIGDLKQAGIDLEGYNAEVKYLIENYGLEKEAALALAAANAKTSKGFENLTSNLKKYKEALEGTNSDTTDYQENLENFRKDLSLLLNTEVTKQFAEGIKNDTKAMDLLGKAIEGNEEAYEEFQRTAGEHLLLGVDFELNDGVNDDLENEVMAVLDEAQASLPDLEVGATLDSTGLTESFNELIRDGKYTADQLSEVLSSFGMEPEITWEPVDLNAEEYQNYKGTVQYYNPDTQKIETATINSISEVQGMSNIQIPVINGKKTTKAPPPPIAKAGNANKGKGGGGGNGGGERKNKELKKASDEIERYHKIDKTIDSLSKQYDRLSAAKDKAFGTSRLKLIEQENTLLQQQTEAEKARLKEVEKYYAEDRSAIEAYGAVIDENGVISNYDQIMQQELDRLNAAYEEYNAGGLSDEIIEAKEKEYEEFKKILEQFEETNGEYLDQLQKVEEAIRAEITAELERIQAKIEVQLELPEHQIKMLDFKLSLLENKHFKSGERIAIWSKELEKTNEGYEVIKGSIEEILALQDENGDWSGLGLTPEQVQRLLTGDKTILDEIKLTGENASEIMEVLLEKEDELQEKYKQMADYMKSIEEELTNQLDEYNEAFEKQISKMEKLQSIVQAMKDTINTIGKEVIGVPASIMRSINNNILKSSAARANAYKAEYEVQAKNLKDAQEKLEKASEEYKEYWQDMVDTAEEAMNEAKENMLAQIQDYAEQAATILEESLAESFAEMGKNLYGMTLDDAQAAFDRYTTLSEDFLQDYQKIYELSKMTRSIQASINDTDNIKAKQALRDLQEEINEYQAEGVQMTQYEVDYLNKKYELRLAEIALEEAQNAKDQVRLSRNADGGWGYVYTANQQNIDQAQQNYEDKLKEIQDLNYQILQETQSGILGLQKEFEDAIQEVYKKGLNKEETDRQINDLRNFYIQRAKNLGTRLDTALGNNRDVYDIWGNNKYGYGVSSPSNYMDYYSETFLGSLNPAFTSGTALTNSFINQIGDINTPGSIIGDSYQSWLDYTNNTIEMLNSIGYAGEDFAETATRWMNETSESIDDATNSVHELAQAMSEELPTAMNAVADIQNEWGPALEKAEELITNLGEALEDLINKMNEYNDTDLKALDIPDSSGLSNRYTAAIAAGSGNGGDSGSGGIGGGSYDSSGNPENNTKNYQKSSIITLNFTQPWYNNRLFSWSSYDSNELDKKLKEYYTNNSSSIMSYFQKNKNNSNYGKYLNWGTSDVVYGPYYPSFKQWVRDITGASFDTGGYTGKFGPEGKLAMLHEKELVLNKQDTLNMLKMVALARDALGQVSIGSSLIAQTAASGYASGQTGFNSQNVSIEAHFPNVVDHNEIEQAFNNLANYAAQNAYNFDLPQRVNLF